MFTKLLQYKIFIFLFILPLTGSIAQSSENHQIDTAKLKLLRNYVKWTYNYGTQKEFDSSNLYSKRALSLAKQLDNNDLIGVARNNSGANLYFQSKLKEAKLVLNKNISNTYLKDSVLLETYFILSDISLHERAYKKAVTHLFSVEKITKSIGLNTKNDSLNMSSVNIRLGDVYKQLKDYAKAHEYYKKASEYLDDENQESYITYFMAELFEEENKINKAIAETKRALSMASQGEEGKLYRPTYYLKLSNLYLKINKPDSASYFGKLGVKDNDDCQLDLLNMAIGDSYHFSKDYQLASKYYNDAVESLISIETESKLREKLRENYTRLGNHKKALEENRIFLKLKDSLNNLRVEQEITEITEKYESNKKQLEIDRLELESIKQTTLIDKQQAKIIFGTTTLILSIIILMLVLFYYFKQKMQKQQLFARNLQLAKQLNQNYKDKGIKKVSINKIDDLQLEKICLLIENLIKEELFLDPEMTLNKMAKLVNTNTSYLSKIINANYNKTFSTFLNELRIDYTLKKFESNEDYHKLTVDHIAEKSGFASSSTFYNAFKKVTGLTPSYYIKKRVAQKKNL